MILSAKALEALGTGRLESTKVSKVVQYGAELVTAGTVDEYWFHLTSGALDRKTYQEVDKVLRGFGGTWMRKSKAHHFASDPSDAIDLAICSGEVDAPADRLKAAGYFPTPRELCKRLVAAAEVQDGNLVLEPSAGRGNIVVEIAAAGGVAHCYELLPENASQLSVVLEFWRSSQKKPHSLMGVKDFLDVAPPPLAESYDRVVMNPPFGKSSDAKHVLHALKFLRPGGRLAGICSAGVKYRNGRVYEEFRAAMTSIEDLPEGSFKESGTMTHTVLVTAEKKR